MKKIGIGFVGAGWMGSVQLKRLTERNDVEILALLEPNAQRGVEVLKGVGLSESLLVTEYQQIINNNIDAVRLVSLNSFHSPQSIAAMKAGKHVFSEKPCATTFADFAAQIELEQANPRLIKFVVISCTSTRWSSGCATWSPVTNSATSPRYRSTTAIPSTSLAIS